MFIFDIIGEVVSIIFGEVLYTFDVIQLLWLYFWSVEYEDDELRFRWVVGCV